MQKLNVIYLDDEALALENFKATMEPCAVFHQISLFLHAGDALEHAAVHPIDFAFLDIDLPGTSGFIVSEQLKAICPSIRIAFITGNVRYMSKRNQVVNAPYIFKPYSKADVLGALLQVV